jgi:hypothetical protein
MLPFSTVFIFYFGIVPRPLTQIRAQFSGFDQALQLKMTGLNLFYWAETSALSEMRLCKCFPNGSKITTLTHNWGNSDNIENAIILNIIHSIFSIRDTEVVICI